MKLFRMPGDMDRKLLRGFGVAIAILFWVAVWMARVLWFKLEFSWPSALLELAVVALGSTLFWTWIVDELERQDVEVQQRTQHLEALHSASLSLTTELELDKVLQKVVDLSRALIHARYGALGLLDEDQEAIERLIVSGLSADAHERIGPLPSGEGLLGELIREGKSIRINDIAQDHRAIGFPTNHPRMRSFLGVPIVSKGKVFGNLYLADKLSTSSAGQSISFGGFSQEDQEILQMFATQAAIAIENAQLYRQNQQIAVLQERERIGMDLHDGVIQSIYAIGLLLDDGLHRMESKPEAARARIRNAIAGLNQVIKDIRNYIHDLQAQRVQGHNLQQGLEEMVRELRASSRLNVELEVKANALKRATPQQTLELLHVAQEALSNIRKHAHASSVQIRAVEVGNELVLTIEDNGVGFDVESVESMGNSAGNGLHNMRERMRALNGSFQIASTPGAGTRITLSAPFHG